MLAVFAILPFFSTLLGGIGALKLQHRLHPVMAFAAGVLVATAVVELLPEASDLTGDSAGPLMPGAATVLGFLLFSALEAFVHRQTWEHQHEPQQDPAESHTHGGPAAGDVLGIVGPLGLVVHSTLDGLAIGFAFRAGEGLGLVVALAVLAHDFADGMNVVTLALSGGHNTRVARTVLLLDALAPPFGVVLGRFVGVTDSQLGGLLALFAGIFIAIGAGHLLPEAQHRRPGESPALVLLSTLGACVVLAVRTFVA